METIELFGKFIDSTKNDKTEEFFKSLTLEEIGNLHLFSKDLGTTCSQHAFEKINNR